MCVCARARARVCVCVFVCVCVCEPCIFVVYANGSDWFDIGDIPIKVKVTEELLNFYPFTTKCQDLYISPLAYYGSSG